MLMPAEFQDHCCVDCTLKEKQCGAAEKVPT